MVRLLSLGKDSDNHFPTEYQALASGIEIFYLFKVHQIFLPVYCSLALFSGVILAEIFLNSLGRHPAQKISSKFHSKWLKSGKVYVNQIRSL